MKQIAHGVDEPPPRLFPGQRIFQPLRVHLQVGEFALTPKAIGYPLSVAILTALAHLRAAGDRVPDFICPFDRCFSHYSSPFSPSGITSWFILISGWLRRGRGFSRVTSFSS